jgi:DNA repair protein RadC
VDTNDKRLTIRDWAEDDRPREKMLLKGVKALSDAELLAILIGSGNKNETAVELSRRILGECKDNLNELARLTIADLCKRFKGIGTAKAIAILAAVELGNRRKIADALERKKISSSLHLYQLMEPILSDLAHEEFWIILLNAGNKVIDTKRLTQGGTRQTVVDLPMLLKICLESSAQAVAVVHNHPSGQNFPSEQDDQITQRIKQGCQAVGISFLDHVIVAGRHYYSYSDEGKL